MIFITLLLFYKISFLKPFKIEQFQKYNSIEYVPKIIHQIAAYKKRDQKYWPKIWFKCQQSWKKIFPLVPFGSSNTFCLNGRHQERFPAI